ncbi:hypothetical protein ACIRPR_27215 [Streptomyces griseoflavus]|uniref:hypothetical protein n=1 Tax=Streptomyces griseoflavus TaxID=35619 RepID=UPI0037F209D5
MTVTDAAHPRDRIAACGRDAGGRWRGWITVTVDAGALRRLGLDPARTGTAPGAPGDGSSPPAWWHAAGERYAVQRGWPRQER